MSDPTTPSQTIAIGVTSDIGDVAMAGAALLKVIDDIFLLNNSPAMIALRQNADIQAILQKWDTDLKTAQSTGNLTQIDSEASG